jgi:hypothetical protein
MQAQRSYLSITGELKINEVSYSWGIIILIVKPSVPAGLSLLWNQEPLIVVCIFNPAAGILIGVLEVFIVAVAEAVCANEADYFLGVTGLLMSALIWLTSKESAHEALLTVNLPETCA